ILLVRNVLPVKIGLTVDILFSLRQVGLSSQKLAIRYVNLSGKIGGIDLKKQIAAFYLLIIMHSHTDKRSRDARRDANHICSHHSIPSPGISEILPVERQSGQDRKNGDDQRDRITDDFSFHG